MRILRPIVPAHSAGAVYLTQSKIPGVRPIRQHVTPWSERDVIEFALEDDLDANGWEFGKASKLDGSCSVRFARAYLTSQQRWLLHLHWAARP